MALESAYTGVAYADVTRDIDGDGEVTIRDIGALRLYLADKIDGEGLLLDAGDVDKDGELTIRDIGTLRLYLADKITLD